MFDPLLDLWHDIFSLLHIPSMLHHLKKKCCFSYPSVENSTWYKYSRPQWVKQDGFLISDLCTCDMQLGIGAGFVSPDLGPRIESPSHQHFWFTVVIAGLTGENEFLKTLSLQLDLNRHNYVSQSSSQAWGERRFLCRYKNSTEATAVLSKDDFWQTKTLPTQSLMSSDSLQF